MSAPPPSFWEPGHNTAPARSPGPTEFSGSSPRLWSGRGTNPGTKWQRVSSRISTVSRLYDSEQSLPLCLHLLTSRMRNALPCPPRASDSCIHWCPAHITVSREGAVLSEHCRGHGPTTDVPTRCKHLRVHLSVRHQPRGTSPEPQPQGYPKLIKGPGKLTCASKPQSRVRS